MNSLVIPPFLRIRACAAWQCQKLAAAIDRLTPAAGQCIAAETSVSGCGSYSWGHANLYTPNSRS